MAKPTDPAWHQTCEQEMAQHFLQLLKDKKYVVDTTEGRKSVTGFVHTLNQFDRAVDVKRAMIEAGSSDHALQRKLPVGTVIDVTLKNKHLVIFEKTFAHVRFMSAPPTEALIRGTEVYPMTDREVRAALSAVPPPLPSDGKARVPLTIVLFSSAGFERDAQLLADRLAERTLILVEPNEAGGWTVHGTPETRGVLDLLDPEADEKKKQRIRDAIAAGEFDLARTGIAAEKLATQLKLPASRVEQEFKQIATERRGLTAKRMDGRLVLYRESNTPGSGGPKMPMLDKFKSLFTGANEKKIAFLAERRTQIAQQQHRVNEDVVGLEKHEASLKDEFRKNESAIVRKRITTQLVQLRKEIDRKSQLVQMLNQQANVVAAHLHSLELIQQGKSVQLPSGEELAEDAQKAEEVLAQVQADAELADELVGTSSIRAGMSNEEAAMYDELMKEIAPTDPVKQDEPIKQQGDPIPTAKKSEPSAVTPQPQRRSEASPG